MNVPLYGDEYRKVFGNMATLYPSAQDEPNMTIKITAGGFWTYIGGAKYVEYVGGSSPAITAPLSNAKWVAVCLTRTGLVVNVDGTSGVNPVLPVIDESLYPIALVYVQYGDTKLTNEHIFDARPIFSLPVRDHSYLEGTLSDNCHSISAITGLVDALNAAAKTTDVALALALKADTNGTPDTTFIFNKDFTGVPGSDAVLEVERGSEINVAIRWDETENRWKYTNDGTIWHSLAANDGTEELATLTYVQETEPTLTADHNAAFWIDSLNDIVYLVFRKATGVQVKVQLT